jgi:hypothetical protein
VANLVEESTSLKAGTRSATQIFCILRNPYHIYKNHPLVLIQIPVNQVRISLGSILLFGFPSVYSFKGSQPKLVCVCHVFHAG